PPGAPAPAAVEAALLREVPTGVRLLLSVDGFPALVADPWLNGRLTALHACSDLWASGATVESAPVVVTLPAASAALQEDLLLHTLAGVRSVLDPLGARLLGGHTLEGRDGAGLGLTLTINGLAPPTRHWAKGPLRPGDALLLTRPLGSGVLFAAAMAGAAQPEWIEEALAQMQQSQAPLVALLAAHGCHACTDITGFGLLGHLGEMLACPPESPGWASSGVPAAGGLVVDLEGAAIPAFPGARALLARGYASTLAPANAEALALLQGEVHLCSPAPEALLIDPQTCGPLLAAIPQEQAAAALQALHAAGFHRASVIARLRARP
ncbi:MAG: selenide, water dikinase SelD, partial [Cyanobacteriota bacterium]